MMIPNPKFDKDKALARYKELWDKHAAEFDQLPDVERRVRRGEYNFTSSVDYELAELEREAMHNGYGLTWYWDEKKQEIVYTCEPLEPSDYAACMAEEQEE